jgi:hypothetical protein
MDAMSFGFRKLMYESWTGVPSTMYSGSLFWNELMPRMRTVLRPPGEPLLYTVTPDTLASRRCSTLALVCRSAAATFTLATAPVISPRVCSSE